MATFAQTIALYQKTASLVKDNINQLTAINAEIAAINPKDPNAAQQLANLQAKFDATLAANSAKIREAVAAEQAAYNTLNAIDQLAVRNDPAAAREVTSLTAVKDANKKLVAEKKTAIAANNPPPPAPGTYAHCRDCDNCDACGRPGSRQHRTKHEYIVWRG